MKRFFIFVLVLAIIGGGVWYFFVRGKSPTDNPVANVFQSFFPLSGEGEVFDGTIREGEGSTDTTSTDRFSQVSSRPIAGYSIFSLTNTVTTPNPDPALKPIVTTTIDHYIRYVSRANGYVFEIKNKESAVQISNIMIPNIYEAMFADSNTVALLRFLKSDNQTIATYSVPIPPLNPDGKRTQKQGVYLPDNINSLVVSPDSKLVAKLTTETNGALISTSTPTNTLKKDTIRTPFKEWLVSWPTQSTLYLQTKAASVANGFLYTIDSAQGRLKRVLGDIPGLTTNTSPSGEYILYSQSTQNSFITRLFNTKTGATTPLSLLVLPEKCVWYTNSDLICAGNTSVSEAIYPDAWYAGLTKFQDQLYRIDTKTNAYTVIYDGTARSFDMTNLQLDEGQNLIYFIDKPTGILWKSTL